MKRNLKFIVLSFFCLAIVVSCKDDSLEGIPDWESAVHGLGSFSATTDDVNFIKGDPSVELDMELLWNSIDNKNEVVKMELFVLFNEAYTDQDGNPKTAKHGGDEGKLFLTLEGAQVPGNKELTSFSVSQDDVYALYSSAAWDYDDDGTDSPVWGVGSIRADRNTTDYKFVDGDSFSVRWQFTTDDGRVFDKWGISVCTEFPGANCSVAWAAVCNQTIANPVGNWTINMVDSYGDGWNDAAIRVVVNGVGTNYTLANGAAGTTVVAVAPGTTSLTFEFVSGDWDSEVSFTIVSPKGNVVAKGGPSPGVGTLTLDLCKE